MLLKKNDIKLLYEFDSDYTVPFSKIGKRIHMSQQLISHKIKQFSKKKIIKNCFPLIDYSRMGFYTFTVFFKVHYHNRESFEKIIEQIKQDENVLILKECDGKYDLLVVFAAKNPYSFNKKLKKLTFSIAELSEKTILTNVVSHYYLRDFMVDKEGKSDIRIGGDTEEIELDKLNMKILLELTNGRKRLIDIAKETGSSPKTVLSRIKWLEKKGVVKGYRVLLDYLKIGIMVNIMLLKYNDSAFEQEEKFNYFCKANPNIVEMTKTFGEWDAILQIETKNLQEFRKLFLQIRETFDDIIEDIDEIRIFEVHERKYIPQIAITT